MLTVTATVATKNERTTPLPFTSNPQGQSDYRRYSYFENAPFTKARQIARSRLTMRLASPLAAAKSIRSRAYRQRSHWDCAPIATKAGDDRVFRYRIIIQNNAVKILAASA
jgi:hypothetical protein